MSRRFDHESCQRSYSAELKMMADRLRSMGPVGIKAAMSGAPLDNFPINTMFVFTNPRVQSMGKDKTRLAVRRLRNNYRRTSCHGQAYASRTSHRRCQGRGNRTSSIQRS